MILKVDPTSALPVYDQIREQVTRMALSGVLPAGTRLPTIRQLASDLQVARGTVAKAYTMLEQTMVVESRGHKGTYIIETPVVSDAETALTEAANQYARLAQQLGFDCDAAVSHIERQWATD